MKIEHFLKGVEHDRVHHAIRDAEKGTSGDIVVYVSHRQESDPLAGAHRAFRKLNLGDAADKNSLLIFLAPKTQKFAIVGGTALHEKAGQAWWDDLAGLLGRHFKDGRYTEGLLEVIARAGEKLQTHFPDEAPDRTGQKDIVEE
jgi:uncharacterized membrane protein